MVMNHLKFPKYYFTEHSYAEGHKGHIDSLKTLLYSRSYKPAARGQRTASDEVLRCLGKQLEGVF